MPEQIASLYVAIGANLAGLNQGLSQAQSKLKTVGQRMGSLGRTLSMAVTAPLIGIGVASVKMAADFEQQMGLAQLALRKTGVSMETVSDYALKMGADTIYNAQEMALALTGLGKAGLDWEEIAGDMTGATGVLAAVTNLATASDLELAQAADTLTVAMATFSRPADDAVDIVDNLVMAADASVASVGDLAAGLASAGPVMASFGWDMEDVVTALALLSERGIRGSEAGTALRSMMTNLMRPTDQVKDALGLLNVNLYDSENRLKTLPELIGELSEALTIGAKRISQMSTMTKEEKNELERLQKQHDSLRRGIADYERGIKGVTWSEERRREKVAELQEQLTNLHRVMAPLIASSEEYTTVTQELTEEQRNQLIQTLAGTYGMRAMTTLLAAGTEGIDSMNESIAEGATAAEVADIMMDSLKGRLEELKGGVETLAIKFGGTLAPVIKEFVDKRLIPLVDVLGELDEEQMAGLAKLGLVIAGIGPGLFILAKLPAFLGALTSPIGLLALAATILGGSLFLSSEKGDDFITSMRGIADELKKEEGLAGLGEWIDKIADFSDKLAGLGQWLRDATEWGQKFFGTWEEPGVERISGFGAGKKKGAPTWEQYGEVGKAAWEKIKMDFAAGLEFVVDLGVALVAPPEAQAFADEEAFQAYLDQIEVELPVGIPLTVEPDMGQIEESGRRAGVIWKAGFDSATGGITDGAGSGGILAALQAGGIE